MNKITASFLRKLPRQYHAVVDSLEVEGGLIDNCKYMLYIAAPYDENDLLGGSVPVRNLTEAVQYVKDAHANYEAMQRAEKAEAIIEKLEPRLKDNKRYNLYYGTYNSNGSKVIDGTSCYNATKQTILAELNEQLKYLKIDGNEAEALSLCQITPYGSGYERELIYITAHLIGGSK